MSSVVDAEVRVGAPTRLLTSLRLHRFGGLDPTFSLDRQRYVQALHTPEGEAVIEVRGLDLDSDAMATRFAIRGHGPGAAWVTARADRILGADDDPSIFRASCSATRRLVRQARGLRLARSASPSGILISLVFQQRVAWREAARAYKRLVERHGAAAPGFEGLWFPPTAREWASIPRSDFSALEVDRRRADTVRRVAQIAGHVDALVDAPFAEVRRKLASVPGLGPWTIENFLGFALADPDALPTGDYDLPHRVATVFRGVARSSDAEMIETLEPYRGHRFRIVRMIEESSTKLVRFAPRRGSGRPRGRR